MWPWGKSRAEKLDRAAGTVSMRANKLMGSLYEMADPRKSDREHWEHAVSVGAREANSPEVRQKLRDRARYEVANNSYATGMLDTLAHDLVGEGPMLQIRGESVAPDAAKAVERRFGEWADAIDLWGKVRTMIRAKGTDGESFGVMVTNSAIADAVKLDVSLIEGERVTNHDADPTDALEVDGIRYDAAGNPASYRVLKHHPDSMVGAAFSREADTFDAADVIHYFNRDRPGQVRGVPDLTPSLHLFAQLRRLTLAVLGASEAIASQALALKTQAPPEEVPLVPAGEEFDMTSGSVTVLPEGYELFQPKAEQPTSTYREFKVEILKEAARTLSMPANIALADSADYNFASGRLDHATYDKSIRVRRAVIKRTILDRVFRAWFAEASRISGHLPQSVRREPPAFRHGWTWPMREHGDPLKEALAVQQRLRAGVSNLYIESANRGHDFEEVAAGQARAILHLASLGIQYTEPVAVEIAEVNTDV